VIPAVGKPAPKKTRLAVVAVGALLLFAAACGGGDKQVTGLVLEAVERSPTEIEVLRLRDDGGGVWEFFTEGDIGTSATHLKLHQVAGERIIVTYREVGSRLIASDVKDAAEPGG